MQTKKTHRDPIILSQMRPWTLLLVLCGCILFTFGLIHYQKVASFFGAILSALGPVIAGFIFAYLLNPAETWVEKRLMKLFCKLAPKREGTRFLARVISSFVVVLLFIGSITLLVVVTFSEVVDGISTFLEKLPEYITMVTDRIEQWMARDDNISNYLQQISERLTNGVMGLDSVDTTNRILSALASGAAGTLGFLYDVVIGFIIAVYVLISRERFLRQWKCLLFALVKPKTAVWIDRRMRMANKTFGTAVIGKFADSVIIGLLCFIGMLCLKMPYVTLISVVIGVTNMIPFFGPIIGAIPCTLLILMENPMKSLYFLIFIVILQQFDCNILDPRIVGSSIGLPAFWELFACLLGGGLFGIVGMAVGVPTFAVLYNLVRELVSERLQNRDLPDVFLQEELGITPLPRGSGLFDDTDNESQYVQHFIMLEDIAPAEKTQTESQLDDFV